MYGPYPALNRSIVGTLNPATGVLYWMLSSTWDGVDTYNVVISYIGRDIILHSVTCPVNVGSGIGNGAPLGPILRDHSTGNLFIYVENGYGYGTWHQFTSAGVYVSNLGGLSAGSGPLLIRQDTILDGAGNMIHLHNGGVTIITLTPFAVQGTAALTYSGSCRITIGAAHSIWIISTDGTNGAIDLITLNTNPAPPTVTPYLLGLGGAFVVYTIEYNSASDTLLFWWNGNLYSWSCTTHSVVNSISNPQYLGSGPLQGGLLTAGIQFYEPDTLTLSTTTALGCNDGLPDFTDGTQFKHFFDLVGRVIWLQVSDADVYGVLLCGPPPPPPPPSPRCANVVLSGVLPTLELTVDLDTDWTSESTFIITQDTPLPFTLRGLVFRDSYNPD